MSTVVKNKENWYQNLKNIKTDKRCIISKQSYVQNNSRQYLSNFVAHLRQQHIRSCDTEKHCTIPKQFKTMFDEFRSPSQTATHSRLWHRETLHNFNKTIYLFLFHFKTMFKTIQDDVCRIS